ncbi:MAG TPA: nucleotidyltransferase domain-containing protein [Chroococcales cyanobacterium]|jgi:predicted nucleotidyltransferase
MNAIDSLPTVVERIVETFHPEQILLFGSWARGDARPDSDLDLLVVMPEGTPKRVTAAAIQRCLLDLRLPIDVIVVTPSEVDRYRDYVGTIIRPALKEGKVLYETRRAS